MIFGKPLNPRHKIAKPASKKHEFIIYFAYRYRKHLNLKNKTSSVQLRPKLYETTFISFKI